LYNLRLTTFNKSYFLRYVSQKVITHDLCVLTLVLMTNFFSILPTDMTAVLKNFFDYANTSFVRENEVVRYYSCTVNLIFSYGGMKIIINSACFKIGSIYDVVSGHGMGLTCNDCRSMFLRWRSQDKQFAICTRTSSEIATDIQLPSELNRPILKWFCHLRNLVQGFDDVHAATKNSKLKEMDNIIESLMEELNIEEL